MEPRAAINAVEVVLRDLIEQILAEHLGADAWIDECGCTPDRIQKWRDRQEEEAKRRDGTVPERRLLYYSDFSDLTSIIAKHWETFKPCFGDRPRQRKTFDVYMQRLEDFRNPEMHSRSLLPFEAALVEGITGEIRNKVTIYRGVADDLDRHFPRIEYVRDSFGHYGTDSVVPTVTGITLHPGEDVSFECSGWDPDDRPLTWNMSVSGDPALNVHQGRETRFDWLVTEANIAASTFVRVKLIGDRPWHRGAGDDGEVILQYRVLPP
jgi:hypothetical protein